MRLENLILSHTQNEESLCLYQSLFSLPTFSSTTFPIRTLRGGGGEEERKKNKRKREKEREKKSPNLK